MPSLRSVIRGAAAALLVPVAFALPSCHGSNSTTSSGPVAGFAPDKPAPGPATIALLPGSSSGVNVKVRVTVTGVNQFFGAAFYVKYDTTALLFNGMDDSTSFLRTLGTLGVGYTALETHDTPGVIKVTATALNSSTANVNLDVTTTSDLVVLNFAAHQAIVAASTEGRLDFDDSTPPTRRVQVCDTASPPVCTYPAVEWFGGGVFAQ